MKIDHKKIGADGIKLIIKQDGREAAHAYLYILRNDQHKRPFSFMEDVFVNEEYRGQGLGTKLIKELIKLSRKNNCYKLIGTSRSARPKVHNLYVRLGFKDWGKEFRIDF
jgi:GNAT superfamily N-acetyltransferase